MFRIRKRRTKYLQNMNKIKKLQNRQHDVEKEEENREYSKCSGHKRSKSMISRYLNGLQNYNITATKKSRNPDSCSLGQSYSMRKRITEKQTILKSYTSNKTIFARAKENKSSELDLIKKYGGGPNVLGDDESIVKEVNNYVFNEYSVGV